VLVGAMELLGDLDNETPLVSRNDPVFNSTSRLETRIKEFKNIVRTLG